MQFSEHYFHNEIGKCVGYRKYGYWVEDFIDFLAPPAYACSHLAFPDCSCYKHTGYAKAYKVLL